MKVLALVILGILATCNGQSPEGRVREVFDVAFEFAYFNFTWRSPREYQQAVRTKRYIPQGNIFSGIKVYNDTIYLTLPRQFPGSPVTVATLSKSAPRTNPLLTPYPSWEMNVGESCETLQNVGCLEIDPSGILWIVDAFRSNDLSQCPPKIVLLDLNRGGALVQSYTVPNYLCPWYQGGWYNDLVVDNTDGGYAYISDSTRIDPGLVVYHRRRNTAWKIRDATMFAEIFASGYYVNGYQINTLDSIDGIALGPVPRNRSVERYVYYSAYVGVDMYAISTSILRNETACLGSEWRKTVIHVARKVAPSDGLIVDNQGFLYFGVQTQDAIARWNIYEPFNTNASIVYQNRTTANWPDSFGFDQQGNLFLTCNFDERVTNGTQALPFSHNISYRILVAHTGTGGYQYS